MKYICIAVFCLLSPCLFAQEKTGSDSVKNTSASRHSITFSGLLQVRYTQSLTDSVDVNGKNFSGEGISSTFALKRIRLQARTVLNQHLDAVILMNFAEFSANPQNRVLENAFIGYHLSKAFNLQFGQFRPYFGPEDALPADFVKSLDYSNQYYAFCANGWQGFQLGASVYGKINLSLPINYYAGVYNGNNRNQSLDNDNRKNYYGRLEASIAKKCMLGANFEVGSNQKVKGSALGLDVSGTAKLGKKLMAEVQAEFKEGTNFSDFNTSATPEKNISDFRMRGFYFSPDFKYQMNCHGISCIEFCPRYEFIEDNYKLQRDLRQTLTPTISAEFSDDYYTRVQLGVIVDLYQQDIPLSARYSHATAVAQLQVRF